MPIPVVTVLSGGLPVRNIANSLPVVEAANKYGLPVTLVGYPGPALAVTFVVGGLLLAEQPTKES
jgi:hypothetical protein